MEALSQTLIGSCKHRSGLGLRMAQDSEKKYLSLFSAPPFLVDQRWPPHWPNF